MRMKESDMSGVGAMGLASAALSLTSAVSTNNESKQRENKFDDGVNVKPIWFSYKDIICIDLNTVYSIRVVGDRVRFSLRKEGNVETSLLSAFDRNSLMMKVSQKLIG